MIGSGIYFPLSALAFSILLIILFFRKQKIKTVETDLYGYLLIINFVGLGLELLCTFAAFINKDYPLISNFILKSYLVYNFIWCLLLSIYVYYISVSNKNTLFKNKKKKKAIIFFSILTVLIIYSLNCDLIIKDNFQTRYTTGASVNFTYFMCSLTIIFMIACIIINKKNYKNKKYYPIYTFLIAIIIGIIIQSNFPGILIITYIVTFTLNIMYHTIENPDVKIINEMVRNNELAEQTYIDKSNFLFELTQEIREPLNNIKNISDKLLNNQISNNNIKNELIAINNSIRHLDFVVNDVLNVNSLDINKIKIINNKYDLKSLCDTLVTRIKPNLDNNIKFRYSMPNHISALYGDNIKIKQILYSLLTDTIKRTNKGFVEFKVNTIEKYDVCRIIFLISNSGFEMPIDEINNILSVTGELNKKELEELEKSEFNIKLCQKIIKSLGGNLLIKSDQEKGTEIILTIDQKIETQKNENTLLQYANSVSTNKKALVISQTKKLTNALKSKLKNKNINASFILYGMDAIVQLKQNKKFDYIIIEDEMKEMSGFETLKHIKNQTKINIPIIIMLNSNKEKIKNHYLEDGFTDYILIEELDDEIERIINKY